MCFYSYKLKLAKIDADKHSKISTQFKAAGYPTLFFFINRAKINYTSGREQQDIRSSIKKKLLSPLTDISIVEEFEALRKGDNISVVLFLKNKKHIA